MEFLFSFNIIHPTLGVDENNEGCGELMRIKRALNLLLNLSFLQ